MLISERVAVSSSPLALHLPDHQFFVETFGASEQQQLRRTARQELA